MLDDFWLLIRLVHEVFLDFQALEIKRCRLGNEEVTGFLDGGRATKFLELVIDFEQVVFCGLRPLLLFTILVFSTEHGSAELTQHSKRICDCVPGSIFLFLKFDFPIHDTLFFLCR